jgi:RNA polymerase sigma-70 factor, ECF subfamily
MPLPTDESLLDSFRRGDHSALGGLARRYERPLLGLATGLLDGRTDMAADAIQETWLRVIRFADKFDARSSFKTWLYRIAINQCRTIKSRSRPTTNVSPAVPAPVSAATEPVANSTPDPDHLSWLREQVALLSPDKRTVLLLCYHEGITHQLAAEILEVPLGTLKSRLHAALTTLRAAMAAEVAP